MRRTLKTLGVVSALVAGIAAAPALYGHESQSSQGSTMGPGMRGGGNRMGQMNQMSEKCDKTMQAMLDEHAAERPNDRFRKDEPAQPGK